MFHFNKYNSIDLSEIFRLKRLKWAIEPVPNANYLTNKWSAPKINRSKTKGKVAQVFSEEKKKPRIGRCYLECKEDQLRLYMWPVVIHFDVKHHIPVTDWVNRDPLLATYDLVLPLVSGWCAAVTVTREMLGYKRLGLFSRRIKNSRLLSECSSQMARVYYLFYGSWSAVMDSVGLIPRVVGKDQCHSSLKLFDVIRSGGLVVGIQVLIMCWYSLFLLITLS